MTKKKEAGNGRAVAPRKPRVDAGARGGPPVIRPRAKPPDDGPGPVPCPVCGRPFHLHGAPCAVFVGAGFLPACGHCAAVLRLAGVPAGRVLAGVLPDGSPVVTDAFNLAPGGTPPN